jgi:pyridoxamine 5'-phosphate oxidase
MQNPELTPAPDSADLAGLGPDGLLAAGWRRITDGVSDRRSSFHTMGLATCRLDGSPTVRTVVLRAADLTAREVRFHTDRRGPKLAELRAQPQVAVLFYDPVDGFQVRGHGTAGIHDDDAVADAAWDATRLTSRLSYRTPFTTGEAVPAPPPAVGRDGDPEWGREHFCVVGIRLDWLDALLLHSSGHRRALFDLRGERPAGGWVAP